MPPAHLRTRTSPRAGTNLRAYANLRMGDSLRMGGRHRLRAVTPPPYHRPAQYRYCCSPLTPGS